MNLANQISRDTARYNPAIERLPDGDIVFHWARRQPWGILRISRLADVTGLDDDLFFRDRGDIVLHVPAEIAAN